MERAASPARRGLQITLIALALLILLGLLAASGYSLRSDFAATASSTNSPIVAQPSKPNGTPAPLKLLKVEPVKGYVGDTFTVTGDGLTPGKNVEFLWATASAAYLTKVLVDNLEYHERKYEESSPSACPGILVSTSCCSSRNSINIWARASGTEDF